MTIAVPEPFPLRRHLAIASAVFLLALAVRLLFLLAAADRHWPHSLSYEGDAVIWARAADLFARGEVPDEGVPHRFYAIAYLLHWLGPEPGATSYLPFKIAWCVWSAIGCGAGYLVLARHLPGRPAAIATALCVFSFGSYVFATSLNVEGLYAPLLLPIVGGMLELARKPSWWWVAVMAVLNALALLTREEHAVLLLLLCVQLAVTWWRAARLATGPRPEARSDSPPWPPSRPPSAANRIAMPAAVLAGAVLLCLPYSVHATRATVHYNTVPRRAPAYDGQGVEWPAEARAFVESLPAFVRGKTVTLVTRYCRGHAIPTVTAELARSVLLDFFGYLPEPLATPVFIASHGPMSFALANHPESNGAFVRAGLETAGQRDPRLNLTLPQHLRIFNHGYAVGWGYIASDVPRWFSNVAKKMGHAFQGIALGFTGYNLPPGRFGERRPCDLLTPWPGEALVWQLLWGAIIALGGFLVWRRPIGRLSFLVIAYKAAIVIAYYGYARQTASILPVFLLLAALGMDAVLSRAGRLLLPRSALSTRAQALIGGVFVLAAIGADIHAATHPASYQISGPVTPTPQWGPQSFSANGPLEIRPIN